MSAAASQLPDGLLVAWYGDDFTGSAAVMEVLSFSGVESVLFLGVPTLEQRAKFPNARAIGLAGTSRSHNQNWMAKNLPQIFDYLKSLNAAVTHYKVCSTLDSSPEIGSIGYAIDLAQSCFDSSWVPLFLAAPAIRRFQCFGHLFAGSEDSVFRLDRHPVMSRHPVTPMTESDVAVHIQSQTERKVTLINLEILAGAKADKIVQDAQGDIVSIDALTVSDMSRVGDLIWNNRATNLFAVGSQGVEYALVDYWVKTGQLETVDCHSGVGACSNLVVISGSVSQTTKRQMEWAIQNGFEAIRFDACCVLDDDFSKEIDRVVVAALKAIENGKDPLIFSAMGPNDPAVATFWAATRQQGVPSDIANNQVGQALGQVLDQILRKSNVSRAVISGGDTSGHALQQLGIYALTALAPTIPGAALFQAHSEEPELQDLQIALKGGQMGTDDYFGWIKQGGGAAGNE